METPLGRTVLYPRTYDRSVLYPIARSRAREALGLGAPLPFAGFDLWRCYELSWLAENGCPQVGMCEIRFPCEAPFIIESKSLKLYLGSFNGTKVGSAKEVERIITEDLARASGNSDVVVTLCTPVTWPSLASQSISGECIDCLQPSIDCYERNASLLSTRTANETENIYSHLLRTVCPVTGQPDWATISISYTGKGVDHESLVRYLASFREHAGFHEECAETIFVDLVRVTEASTLSVTCYFTRRGGIDITPVRYLPGNAPRVQVGRTIRQ